jgi:GGDEF domain-containing protein
VTKKKTFFWEIMLAFAVADCLNFLLAREDPGFLQSVLHPYWIIILLVAARYGFVPGLAAGIFAALHVFAALFRGLPTRNAIEKMLESQGFVLPVAFVLVGVLLGDIRQRSMDTEEEKKRALAEKEEALRVSREKLEGLEKARRILEARIVGETTTLKTLYQSARNFESLDLDEIYRGCLKILVEHFHVHQASLYMHEGDYFVLKATQGWPEGRHPEGKVFAEESMMQIVLWENKPITIKDILAWKDSHRYAASYGELLAMIPLRDGEGRAEGVVNIEKMDFLAYNRPTLEMIETVVEWAALALDNVRFFQATKSQLVLDETYGIYNFRHFENVLASEFERAGRYDLKFTVALAKIERYGFMGDETQKLVARALVALLNRFLESTDMVFKYRFDGTFAVIAPMRSKAEMDACFLEVERAFRECVPEGMRTQGPVLLASSTEYLQGMQEASEMTLPLLKECRITWA